jgi:hypothetical protein
MQAPSPMLIAVGMYLPFETSAAMFVGGLVKWWVDGQAARKKAGPAEKLEIENRGTLIASGFIAGEALMGVGLSCLAVVGITSLSQLLFGVAELPLLRYGNLFALAIFAITCWWLVRGSLRPGR